MTGPGNLYVTSGAYLMSEIILESMSRAVGYGGWGIVMIGVLVVMVGMMAGGRRRCGRVTVPVGREREKITRTR